MNIRKFFDDSEKPFHSHTFAEAAKGAAMGAASAQSFGQRHQMNKNRKLVSGYKESVVAGGGRLREEYSRKTGVAPIDQGVPQPDQPSTRQGFNAGGSPGTASDRPIQVPKRGFTEPPSRPFNPFS